MKKEVKKLAKEVKIQPIGVRVYPSELKLIQKEYGTLQAFVAKMATKFAKKSVPKVVKTKLPKKTK
jgi:hypothetical protein